MMVAVVDILHGYANDVVQDPASPGGPHMVVEACCPPGGPVADDQRWMKTNPGTGAGSMPEVGSMEAHEASGSMTLY
jgi:hypothetical protein